MYLFPTPVLRASHDGHDHYWWSLSGVPAPAWRLHFLQVTHQEPAWWLTEMKGRAAVWRLIVQDALVELWVSPFLMSEGLVERRLQEAITAVAHPEMDISAAWWDYQVSDPELVERQAETDKFLEALPEPSFDSSEVQEIMDEGDFQKIDEIFNAKATFDPPLDPLKSLKKEMWKNAKALHCGTLKIRKSD